MNKRYYIIGFLLSLLSINFVTAQDFQADMKRVYATYQQAERLHLVMDIVTKEENKATKTERFSMFKEGKNSVMSGLEISLCLLNLFLFG